MDFEANRLIATDPFFPVVAQTPAGSKPIDAPRRAFEERQRIIERGSGSHRAISPCKVGDYAAYPPGALSDNLSDETGIPNGKANSRPAEEGEGNPNQPARVVRQQSRCKGARATTSIL